MTSDGETRRVPDALASLDDAITRFFRVFEVPAVREFVAAKKPPGLDMRHHRVLRAVESLGRPSVGEVAERLDLEFSTVSRLLDKAIDAGLLARERDPDDGRRRVLSLTPAGQRDLAATVELRLRVWEALAEGLDPDDIAAAVRVFEHVRESAETFAASSPED